MEARTHTFKANAREALQDENLRQALGKAKGGFVGKRAGVVEAFPDFEALRDRGEAIKDHTLTHLDHYLERFTHAVSERGGQVHYAMDAASARETVMAICRDAQARSVIKSKTMAGEEAGEGSRRVRFGGTSMEEKTPDQQAFRCPSLKC